MGTKLCTIAIDTTNQFIAVEAKRHQNQKKEETEAEHLLDLAVVEAEAEVEAGHLLDLDVIEAEAEVGVELLLVPQGDIGGKIVMMTRMLIGKNSNAETK